MGRAGSKQTVPRRNLSCACIQFFRTADAQAIRIKKSPRMLFGFADANASRTRQSLACARKDVKSISDAGLIQVERHTECAGQVAWSSAEHVVSNLPPSLAHMAQAFNCFSRANQDGSSPSAIRGDIQAEVYTVAAIDIDMPEAVVHNRGAWCSAKSVGGFIIGIGLDFDNPDQAGTIAENAAYQVRCHVQSGSGKEVRSQTGHRGLDKKLGNLYPSVSSEIPPL